MQPTAVGVIGVGRIGTMHTHNLVHHVPEARVKAVASPHVDRDWAATLGIPVATADPDELLHDPDIEAVVIATPSGRHVEMIRRAAHAGKQIFCEKPVAFEPQAIAEAIAAAEGAGVRLQVGFNRRFDPSICRLAEAVRAGEVGRLHSLRVINRDPRRPPVDFVRRSGGMFFDFTIHDLDTLRFLSGSEIEEVYAVGAALVDPEIGAAGDIDTAIVTARLADGALCVIDNSRETHYGYDQRFEAFGSNGNLTVDNLRPTTVTSYLKAGVYEDTPLPSFIERYHDAFIGELRGFLAAIREGRPVAASGADALAAVEAAVAAKTSLAENRPVKLAGSTPVSVGGGSR
jgi:myo-inositol 2-dehydrogenase/D-chiro-inositol 1-dehydrogenase